MPTYRLQLEYDGTSYHGWQIQPDVRTVQGEIERALALLSRERVVTVGAGRTDRGVHARGQVVSFDVARPLDPRRVIAGIHGICGPELRARVLEEAPPGFHARHDARGRTYSYRLLAGPSSLWRAYAALPGRPVSLSSLRSASVAILGTHDFRAFANASPDEVDPRCTVTLARWDAWEEGLRFRIQADHFLYKMVRNLVGTLLREAASGGGGARAIQDILAEGLRERAAPPAPAHGLCLETVDYVPPWPLPR
jgi:tRNA pseudouridine38-40 synthase